jgi:hypothetical protein
MDRRQDPVLRRPRGLLVHSDPAPAEHLCNGRGSSPGNMPCRHRGPDDVGSCGGGAVLFPVLFCVREGGRGMR